MCVGVDDMIDDDQHGFFRFGVYTEKVLARGTDAALTLFLRLTIQNARFIRDGSGLLPFQTYGLGKA